MSRAVWPDGFTAFADLPDPRIDRPLQHSLAEIVVIAICAVLAGADSWVQIAAFGRTKETWLRTFLTLPHGVPSHDTFGRVFAVLDPQQFAACYQDWLRAQVPGALAAGAIIAVDGKTARRSHDRMQGHQALHAISAWATESGVALGQIKVADHENEISALPTLLEQVVVEGAVVTIDAIGCQREVAKTIVTSEGDYVLALKANQPETWTMTRETFAAVAEGTLTVDRLDWHETLDKGHGRLERRTCRVIEDGATVAWLQTHEAGAWTGLRTLVEVHAQRRTGETVQDETHYYLSSLGPDAARLNAVVRRHWAIENSLHWVLDVVFDEDRSRIRQGAAAENAALLRKIALSLLRQEPSKLSIVGKRLQAAWDERYLAKVLGLPSPITTP
jgi:predicted transposase YbfD/YdcC